MGNIKTFIDALMVEVAGISNDSTKTTAPYYQYGMKYFDTQGQQPPQIRFQPNDFTLTRLQQNQTSGFVAYGSAGIIEQSVQCTIWGATEQAVWNELNYFLNAHSNIKNAEDNPLNITQETLVDNFDGRWIDTSAKSTQGEMITFEFNIRFNVPTNLSGSTNLVTIVSESFYITGSNEIPVVSGSSIYEGIKHFTGVSGSTYF